MFTILLEKKDFLQKKLREKGIETNQVHFRNDKYSVYKEFAGKEHLKGCDEFCSKMTNIPVGWWLTEEDRVKIVNVVNAY